MVVWINDEWWVVDVIDAARNFVEDFKGIDGEESRAEWHVERMERSFSI